MTKTLLLTVATMAAVVVSVAALVQEGARASDPQLLAWSEALKKWSKEKDSAALELARGILFDCAAHRPSRDVFFDPDKSELAGNRACRAGRQRQCAAEAERAFAKATKLDPSLTEARLRSAAARSERRASDGTADLAAIFAAPETAPELRYLAAIFLGRNAWMAEDAPKATDWFAKAAALNPSWTAARVLLDPASATSGPPDPSVLSPAGAMDPFYAYRCGVFTASVREDLAVRIRRKVGQ